MKRFAEVQVTITYSVSVPIPDGIGDPGRWIKDHWRDHSTRLERQATERRLLAISTEEMSATSSLPDLSAKATVSPKEARALLGIGERQLYELLMRKRIASFTIGRSRRIPMEAIQAFIRERLADAE